MIWKRLKNLWLLSALEPEIVELRTKDERFFMKKSKQAEIIDIKDPIDRALEEFDK